MKVFALDVGQRSGFAVGVPGSVPKSGTVILKEKNEPRSVALGNMIAFLQQEFMAERPAMIAKEAPLPLEAFRHRGNSEAAVLMAHGLHGIIEAMAQRFGIPVKEAHPATIRKHLLGIGRLGSREETKLAVLKRCWTLNLMPRTSFDEDRADAIAVWEWACQTHARKSASSTNLFLFGEQPR